jgi:hypothetical protein
MLPSLQGPKGDHSTPRPIDANGRIVAHAGD